ncbi:ATP-dependent helicase [Anaerolentibacter hominis]|uniref:ATP-dependent helicase n=1 Tax=Anaerolentibacter hominis TaxID=3079009 RepID=UPI003CCE9E72
MIQWNEAQKSAIKHISGPMLVLAGPGSGKTAVICERVRFLIEEAGINPRNILVITFTNAAAGEMKNRFLAQTPVSGVTFGTFHSIFFQILKHAYGYNGGSILRQEEKRQFLRESMTRRAPDVADEADFLSGLETEIGRVKEERMDLNYYYSTTCANEIFQKIYEDYEKKIRAAGKIDFEDMLVFTYELLSKRPDIRKLWQEKYQYILIDEFQDINKIQYDTVRLLAAPGDNLFIVGDDDQSIYRFRGARPEIMLGFEKDYPKAVKVTLNVNYRCAPAVVKAAGRVIQNNRVRYEKEISAYKEQGEQLHVCSFSSARDENKSVVEEILAWHEKGIPFEEMAVLVRTNTQPRSLLERMMEYNIPFRTKDHIPNLYDHWIVKDLVAYMNLARGPVTRRDFLQVMNRPNRYIARDMVEGSLIDLDELKEEYAGKNWMLERLDEFAGDLDILEGKTPYSAIVYIAKGIGYEDYLTEYARYRKLNVEELFELLEEIKENAKPFQSLEEWLVHMQEYKERLLQEEEKRNQNPEGVVVSTMHSAKGLEFQVVFLVDVNEGITPYRKAVVEADLEEERRMFYVALTRAKEQLYIYSVKERYGKALEPSRFLGELKVDSLALVPDAVLIHKVYGKGVVKAREGGKLTVYFPEKKMKKILDLEFCIQSQLIVMEE